MAGSRGCLAAGVFPVLKRRPPGRVRAVLIAALGLAGWTGPALADPPRRHESKGAVYHVARARTDEVRVLWQGAEGQPLRTIPRAAAFLRQQGEEPRLIVNGGIFEPGGVPSGLLVQDGEELRPLNQRPGKGNFYLLPNGVFGIGKDGAWIVRSNEYPPAGAQVLHAVQSGPLLLRGGRIHPKFRQDSKSRLHRNGVGVTVEGDVLLVITDFHSPRFPNLFEFAEVFRDLGCDDALFLDGDLSQMKWGKELDAPSNRFGSMIAVVISEPVSR